MSRQTKKQKKSNSKEKQIQDNTKHQTVKVWHRVGALVLVAALIVSMLAMYMF